MKFNGILARMWNDLDSEIRDKYRGRAMTLNKLLRRGMMRRDRGVFVKVERADN